MEVINTQNSLFHNYFTNFIVHTLQVIYVYYICVVEILCDMLLHTSSQLSVHISSLKSATVGIFTPRKSANTTNQG